MARFCWARPAEDLSRASASSASSACLGGSGRPPGGRRRRSRPGRRRPDGAGMVAGDDLDLDPSAANQATVSASPRTRSPITTMARGRAPAAALAVQRLGRVGQEQDRGPRRRSARPGAAARLPTDGVTTPAPGPPSPSGEQGLGGAERGCPVAKLAHSLAGRGERDRPLGRQPPGRGTPGRWPAGWRWGWGRRRPGRRGRPRPPPPPPPVPGHQLLARSPAVSCPSCRSRSRPPGPGSRPPAARGPAPGGGRGGPPRPRRRRWSTAPAPRGPWPRCRPRPR